MASERNRKSLMAWGNPDLGHLYILGDTANGQTSLQGDHRPHCPVDTVALCIQETVTIYVSCVSS